MITFALADYMRHRVYRIRIRIRVRASISVCKVPTYPSVYIYGSMPLAPMWPTKRQFL